MAQEIKFSLLYRDMWQSSGKYVPTVEQLTEVAPAIIDMGCFDRIETNGGGFEQINLLFGENPNKSVREWTQPFNDAGIQTHMLERGLNAIRMSPVPADVRRLMFHVKKKQGTDIARSFDGLNDPRNLENSIKYAKEAGMISQAALCITVSPVHTVEYYTQLADTLIEMGADEICIKDMAGVGRPASIGKIIKNIKARHPKTVIQYHGHAGPGFQMASILEAAYAGADYIDAGMEPLSWGTGHADILAIQAMLKDAGFNVPKINMNAYMKVRTLTQKYMDDFLGYYINPKNRMMNSLLIGPGLPGGMMGSLMSDLENNLASINKWKRKHNQNELTQDDLMIKLFEEVTYVWPKVGYPPLVTPYSQYVKNLALMNVLQLEKGKKRWSMIADNVWDMILGKTGKLPVDPAPEIIEMAKSKGLEFYTGNPQDLYPDQLDEYRAEMEKKTGTLVWMTKSYSNLQCIQNSTGHINQVMQNENLMKILQKESRKEASESINTVPAYNGNGFQPKTLVVNIDEEEYVVHINYPDNGNGTISQAPTAAKPAESAPAPVVVQSTGQLKEIPSPLEGKFFLTKDSSETAIKVGDKVKKNDIIGYIESMKTYNAIASEVDGTVTEICFANGDTVDEDDILIKLQ